MNEYKLRQDRADVIVPAASIYIDIAKAIGADRMIVPKIGLTDGIAHLIYEKWKAKKEKKAAKEVVVEEAEIETA